MATLMKNGDSKSDILHARTDFLVIARAESGSIAGDWIFKISPDKTNWTPAHDVPFSDTKLVDIIAAPFGAFFQLTGGTGTNLNIDVFYYGPTAHLLSIENDIIKVN